MVRLPVAPSPGEQSYNLASQNATLNKRPGGRFRRAHWTSMATSQVYPSLQGERIGETARGA